MGLDSARCILLSLQDRTLNFLVCPILIFKFGGAMRLGLKHMEAHAYFHS